ncbi:adhesion G protein-coupled receptor L4-like [Actinia tenebrosa]|uniref:Adhesion G protein-coupled receptor L4-like n=1 Tax=Actinia tenebrosa TaxID=6105 RepID=A0A6P8HR14_ACTTE|nr:adhesion G protein-coupled receptor L4-like [Actinia tenebrosa]
MLQSRILSISVKPHPKILIKNVTLKLSTSQVQPSNDYKKLCVFWDFSTRERKQNGWSNGGCTLVKSTGRYVECSCNHLTHFAVLMQVKDEQVPQDHDAVLTVLTNIGLSLSIVGCILTFFAYWRFTDSKSEQSQIRMNLVLVLAVAHVLFLLGSAAKVHLILCISVAALMQLFYTSALCWMFAEGIQLYMQVIKVFNTNLKMRQVYGFAWGLPLILIVVSLSIAGNGSGGLPSFVNDKFCWLSVENKLVWTFIAPVLLLILIKGKLRRQFKVFDENQLKLPSSAGAPYHSNQTNPKQKNMTSQHGHTLQKPQEDMMTLSDFDHSEFQDPKGKRSMQK